MPATSGGSASRGGGCRHGAAWLIAGLALACAGRGPVPDAASVTVATLPPPSAEERYCAWYGDAGDDGVLYFGVAAFWSSMAEAGGDPEGDLLHPGPQLVGRFDLARERMLPPLRVDGALPGPARSGVWDVLADDGRVWFTTFFEAAGIVDAQTGEVASLEVGPGLNELAPGPDGTVLATRYGSGTDEVGDGELLAFRADGTVARRWALRDPAGRIVAPKTPAWDPRRGVFWLTTDLLPPPDAEGPEGHDALHIGPDGAVSLVPEPPELQFVATGDDGTSYRALADGRKLWLRVTPPQGDARDVPLDDAFASELDFVQDVQPNADGRVAVTRWSGRVHVVQPDGRVGSVRLPRSRPVGLYYTGVLHGDRLCATYCAEVSVVCADAP